MQSFRQYKNIGERIQALYCNQSHPEHREPKQTPRSNLISASRLASRSFDFEGRQSSLVHESRHSHDIIVVTFDHDRDPLNPQNWSNLKRAGAVANVVLVGLVMGYASSVDSAVQSQAARDFGVSEVTESLSTALFLVAFGAGSVVAGPLSEDFGRNPVYIVTMIGFMIFVMASALSPNIGAQLVFRFIAGVFASTPVTCAAGTVADLCNELERVYVFPLFAISTLVAPILGPVAGGFIGESISWRWGDWTTLIMAGVVLTLLVFTQPETYPSILLKWKAQHMRRITGTQGYAAEAELQSTSLMYRMGYALCRPFIILYSEPIIVFWSFYISAIYIILFTFLSGFTFIFAVPYSIGQGMTGLAFLGIIIGFLLTLPLVPLVWKWYRQGLRKAQEQGDTDAKLPPEVRLWYAMFGAWAVPISLFWMGWTAQSEISIWSPLAATILFGFGFMNIFLSCYQYLIDCYTLFAASALASITVARYLSSGALVVAAIPMYANLGANWTCTLMGILSAIVVPVPYILYNYGSTIRSYSKYAIGGKGEVL